MNYPLDPQTGALRILQVGASLPNWGGIEHHMVALSTELQRRGHHVKIVCRPDCFIDEQAHANGVPVVHACIQHPTDWADFGIFLNLLRRERFDALHVHAAIEHLVPAVAAQLRGVPVIVATHHLPFLTPLPATKMVGYTRTFTCVAGVSDYIRRMLVAEGVPDQLCVTIPHGTDADAIAQTTLLPSDMRAAWGIPANAVVVGTAGRIAPEKGVSVFLQALALTDSGIHGVIIGEGREEPALRDLAQSLGIADRVTFAGYRADINNALNALDVFVLPSTWPEPCAAVVQQAMALSKPVIGTNTGGTPEMVLHEQTGLCVPPRDPAALAEAISNLCADPVKREQMGQAGLRHVGANYSFHRMVDRLIDIYRSPK